jgi:hypothetical protein
MKEYNGEKYIVSFTSFGKRFDAATKMVFSLLQQSYKNFHIVMTVFKDDVKDITPAMQLLIDNNILEVIIAEENLCPHLKYFYAMKKYWDKPIITVDDDRKQHKDLIKKLVEKYESLNYKSVISVCAPKMTKNGNIINDRLKWCIPRQRLKPNEKSYIAMAEGFAGVLYPAKCFQNIDNYKNLIKSTLYDDDICLKAIEIIEKIPITQINGKESDIFGINLENTQQFRLAARIGADMNYRKKITSELNNYLVEGWKL